MRQIYPRAWLLVLISAILQIIIFPLPGLYLLCWFALTPLILAVLRARPASELEVEGTTRLQPATPWQGFLLGYVCGIVWYAGTCYWIFDTMRLYGGLNTPMALLVLFLFCCYLGLYHGLFGLMLALLARPRDDRRALVIAPFLWVAVELARTRITGFPWNLLGIAQVDNTALSRIAEWTGVYGISFEIALVNVAFAAAFLIPRAKRNAMLAAGAAAAIVLQAGRLVEAPSVAVNHNAVLVQQNVPVQADWSPIYFQQTMSDLTRVTVDSIASLKSGTADLIIWPESPAPFFSNDAHFRESLSDLARKANAWLIAGAIGSDAPQPNSEGPLYNSALLISPGGEIKARYDKVHLVPFGEYLPFPALFSFAGGLTKEVGQFQHGSSHSPMNAGGELLGISICYESIFPDEVRQSAKHGADVFVNISNDGWYGDSGAYAQHLNQTRMRAIENDRWVLSATDTGVTASIDPWGRIVARVPRKQRIALVAPYALSSVTTFYTRYGDWLAYACAIISVGAFFGRFPFLKQRQKVQTSS